MSLKDLRDAGLTLPHEQWGKTKLQTAVPRVPLLLVFLLALVSGAIMYFADGGRWTWIALGMFLICLGAFTVLILRGIRSQ